MPIGRKREQSERHFGPRTFPPVVVISCGSMLGGISVIDSTDGAARVIQGIITGIGFSGEGAMLKDQDRTGTQSPSAWRWHSIDSRLPF